MKEGQLTAVDCRPGLNKPFDARDQVVGNLHSFDREPGVSTTSLLQIRQTN